MNKKNNDQKNGLIATFQEIEKRFGKGAIMHLDDRPLTEVDVISSGSIGLDIALGVKGYPRGRIIEIYGPEASGKTTLTLLAIAQAQKSKLQCAFIDAEHAIDPLYAKVIGVDTKKLILAQPDSGEQALGIVETLAKSNEVQLIVIDSVAALVPKIELDGEMSDQSIGAQARMMSRALRRLSAVLNKNNCTIIFINQIRSKIGVVFGSNETTSGGRALKFYASIRIDVRKGPRITDGSTIIGHEIKVKVVKNKVAPPFKMINLDLFFGEGISQNGEIIDLASDYGILVKKGS